MIKEIDANLFGKHFDKHNKTYSRQHYSNILYAKEVSSYITLLYLQNVDEIGINTVFV